MIIKVFFNIKIKYNKFKYNIKEFVVFFVLNNMKKILILVMTCHSDDNEIKEKAIKETWAKDVLAHKYPNIDLWFITSSLGIIDRANLDLGISCCANAFFDHKNQYIYTICNDLKDCTFQKLMKSLNSIACTEYQSNYKYEAIFSEYDYIVKVNTSTYINVDLLNYIIQNSINDNEIYAGSLLSQNWVEQCLPFLSGEYYIFSKFYVYELLKKYRENIEFFNYQETKTRSTLGVCDDGWLTIFMHKILGLNYMHNIHSSGLIYEREDKLKYQSLYNNYIGIDCKGISNKLCIDKMYQVYKILNGYQIPENYLNIFESSIKDFCCYGIDEVKEASKNDIKYNFDKKIKKDIIENYYLKVNNYI